MTINEILSAAGLDETKVGEVLKSMKDNKLYIAGEENLDIRYGKLKADHEAKIKELEEANKAIGDLKKAAEGNDAAQAKIAEYEAKAKELQDTLEAERLNNAIMNGLRDAKAKDIDYLKFKLGNELKLNDKGEIEGWADKIAALKKDHPAQFEGEEATGKKVVENKLKNGAGGEHTITRDDFLKMSYGERADLYTREPETYKALMGET